MRLITDEVIDAIHEELDEIVFMRSKIKGCLDSIEKIIMEDKDVRNILDYLKEYAREELLDWVVENLEIDALYDTEVLFETLRDRRH